MAFFIIVLQVVFIIVATIRFKIHPVISLILAAIFAGFGLGLSPSEITASISEGFGKTLSGIGLVIAFGTLIGVFLEQTGGTKVIAMSLLRLIGVKRSPLALNLAGFVISIPVYCDSGFVILSSLNKALSKRTGIPFLVFAIALATGLYAAHVFVPPTPGPLAAASILEADLGKVLIFGLIVALPVSVSGYFWAIHVGKKLSPISSELGPANRPDEQGGEPTINVLEALAPILVPIVLIALKSIADYPTRPMGEGLFFQLFGFFGNPIVAMIFGVIIAILIGRKKRHNVTQQWFTEALQQAGVIIIITGAGGAFGQVIRNFDFASAFNLSSASGFGGLAICFAIAAILKSAQGSSTVSIITTAAIIAPLLGVFGLVSANDKVLAVLAIGAGAMTVSHVNDSYFWVVSQFSNMSVKTALRGHTLATLSQGITAMGIIFFLHYIL